MQRIVISRFRFELTRREKCFVLSLVVLGVCAAAVWGPIQHRLLTWLVLRADAPAQSLVDGLVTRDADPGALLNRLWRTGRIPHRLAVLDHLHSHRASGNPLRIEEVDILRDAARGGDLEAKDKAFALLDASRHPELRGLALEQLRDVDPAVRVVGLQRLVRSGDRQLVPLVVPFLNDGDPRVVAAAGFALGRWTSNDFGFRLSLALPDFKREIIPTTDTAALAQAVARWMEWWNEHHSDFAVPQVELPSASSAWRPSTQGFSLQDLADNRVRLSSFRGKAVLLTFWATTTTNGYSFLSELAEVQRRNTRRFVVLGITLDGTPLANTEGCGDDDEHSGHGHGAARATHVDSGHVRGQVEQFVQRHGIPFPVLMDRKGQVGYRFSALELPTTVILDRAGNVHRRFVGMRSGAVIEAMLADADKTEPDLQQ